jgi:hypothetical protein
MRSAAAVEVKTSTALSSSCSLTLDLVQGFVTWIRVEHLKWQQTTYLEFKNWCTINIPCPPSPTLVTIEDHIVRPGETKQDRRDAIDFAIARDNLERAGALRRLHLRVGFWVQDCKDRFAGAYAASLTLGLSTGDCQGQQQREIAAFCSKHQAVVDSYLRHRTSLSVTAT